MNGTVAPPSSSSTVAATWCSRTPSSAAIRGITASAAAAGAPGAPGAPGVPESAAVCLVTIGAVFLPCDLLDASLAGGALATKPWLRAGGQAGLRAGRRAEPQHGPLAD